MVICTLCLAKHLYIHNEDDPLYFEVRAAEIKENTILKVSYHVYWNVVHGRWTMDDGRWTMDDGRWTMDDGSTTSRTCVFISLWSFRRSLMTTENSEKEET